MKFMGRFKPATKDRQQVSAILKRQVPIRFGEQPSSWLGGLPMMPVTVEWPCDPEGAPLHFVAQICCADLPAELWNGQGPRNGWLLFFLESMKFEDEAESDLVRIIHVENLGPEREPPQDMPTVRHAMSGNFGGAEPGSRPGVPKLWRKWPVDLVAQTYDINGGDEDFVPPPVCAEELYGMPVSENGFYGSEDFGVKKPLTWRGALYCLEGIVRDLDPDNFKRRFLAHNGLLGAPEPDQAEFVDELHRRTQADPACTDRAPGWGPRVEAANKRVKSQLQQERSTGWMKRAYVALDKAAASSEQWCAKYQSDLDAGRGTLDARALEILELKLEHHRKALEDIPARRAYIDMLFAQYPGPDGEQRFNAEIKALGEAHLAWGEEIAERADNCLAKVLSKPLDDPISDADWTEIIEQFSQAKSVFWIGSETRVLAKREHSLSIDLHLKNAIREDLLDLYTRDADGLQSLCPDHRDALEQQLRYIESNLPHRIGGHANPVQGEILAPGDELILQLATDPPMGWMWGDVGAVYVTMRPQELKKMRFQKLSAVIEGH